MIISSYRAVHIPVPLNPIINSYAAALAMRSGAKDLLNIGRRYDMEEHAASLLE